MALKVKVNQDLQKDRNKCNFNIEELTNYLDGGHIETKRRRKIETKVLNVKGLVDEIPEEYLSHKEKYENAVRKSVLYYKVQKENEDAKLSFMERMRASFRNQVSIAIFKDISPLTLHYSMFIPTIIGQGTEKQKDFWLKRAQNLEIIGTYAQTELGHGTFIRGLETTATYDTETEEFILHSPTLSSYKWWPGGLAHTSNYCIVMAQLFTNDKDCGIQPFIVQIRDEETHLPLPGIKVGEIGAKLGFNTANNGFLGFENHRIARDRMLMKFAQVSKKGTFQSPSRNSKLTYGTMIFVRVTIVNAMANQLARAATIAIRYSAVRRQSQLKPNEAEPQILDYVTQQNKLFIAIASSHAFSAMAIWLWDVYSKVAIDVAAGKLEDLPELHSLACCLKAVTTSDASIMVEDCRLSCGGHGYMLSTNLPQVYGLVTAAYTYEGEYTVLMLQTARALVKAWNSASKGKPFSSTMTYLSDKTPLVRWDGSVDGLVKSFQRVATRKLASSVDTMQNYQRLGLSPEDAWNRASVRLVSASEYTSIAESDIQQLQKRYEDLLELIRPNAVGLVDGFDLRDEILQSTLGAYDGNVYERLMEEALKSPLNKQPVNDSFHKYLKPLMRGKL